MLELLESVLDDVGYLELRFQERRALKIHVEEGRVDAANSTHYAGVGVRALVDGAWGFASTSTLTRAAVANAVAQAREAARAAAPHRKQKVGALARGGLAAGSFCTPARNPVTAHPGGGKNPPGGEDVGTGAQRPRAHQGRRDGVPGAA